MPSSQEFLIGWFEYTGAGALLLIATRLIVPRLRQPIDRVNLIVMGLVAAAFLPLLVSLSWVPRWHLGLLETDRAQVAASQPATLNHEGHPSPVPGPLSAAPTAPNVTPEKLAGNKPFSPERSQHTERPRSTEQAGGIIEPTASSASDTQPASGPLAAATPKSTTENSRSIWSIAAVVLLLSYALAFGYFLLEWFLGTLRLKNICRAAQPAGSSVLDTWAEVSGAQRGSIRLFVSSSIAAPLVFGWWRPVILIPESLAKGDRSKLRFCLAHEWSHVLGGDLFAWRLVNFCQYFLWYQPLYWLLRRELRICQDMVADHWAVETTNALDGRIAYAELLMSIAKEKNNPHVVGAIAFHDRSSQLSRRIKMLLNLGQSLRSRSTRVFLGVSGLLILTISLLVGSLRIDTAKAEMGLSDQAAVEGSSDWDISSDNQDQAPDTGETKIVRGRVVSEQGAPIAGARLWLPLQYEAPFVVEATTDDAGNFRLECPSDWFSEHVWENMSIVWAHAPGYSIQAENVYKSLRLNEDEFYTIQLPPEGDSRFRILSPDGKPMSELLVQPQIFRGRYGSYSVPEELLANIATRTGTDGWVVVNGVHSEFLTRLEMVSEEFGRQSIAVGENVTPPSREIRLQPTASIMGRVVGENPEWVRGIKLVFESDNRDPRLGTTGHAEVMTDDEGRFEVPRIVFGGPIHVRADFDPNLPVRPMLPQDLQLDAGETKQLDIPLVAAPLVRGKVVSKDNEPVPNVGIGLRYNSRQFDRATTDKDGRFQARSLPGECLVNLFYVPVGHERPSHSTDNQPHQIADDIQEFEVPTIQLIGSHTIVGQLVDANDQPMPNRRVDALDGNRRYGVGMSDEEGRFQITVPEGVESIVRLRIDDRSLLRQNLEVVQKDPLLVRYIPDVHQQKMDAARLTKPDVTLTGRVLFDGQPIAGVPIILERSSPVFNADGTIDLSRSRPSPADELETDANGNYRLTGLKAGDRYTFYIRPKFGAIDLTWEHYRNQVPEDATGEVSLPDVNLRPLSQSLAGSVVDPDGNPVKDAVVIAQLRDGGNIMHDWTRPESRPGTNSDDQGRFEIKELPDEPLSIFAYLKDPKARHIRFPAKQDVERNQQDIRIVLDPSLIED